MPQGYVPADSALRTAMGAARVAGAILLDHWSRPAVGRGAKSSATDEVSDADRAAEAAVLAFVRDAHPEDALVGEEGSAAKGTSGRRWLVDPLDGTTNYLYRIPQWCVSIACLDGDGPLVAVVLDPLKDELFFAERGRGAWLSTGARRDTPASTEAIGVSAVSDPAVALVATGFSYEPDERREQGRREAQLIGRVRDVRRFGAAALDLSWVACGRVDAYHETVGNEWDWAAGRLLVQEAGGRVTEVPGVRPGVPGLLASGAKLHDALLGVIRAIEPA